MSAFYVGRDLAYFAHLIIGVSLVALPLLLIYWGREKNALEKPVAALTAVLSWLLLLPSGILYLTFYPATKTLIKAGASPWAHSIIMETKEHWGLFIPLIATTAAILVYQGKDSRKWWMLLAALAFAIGVLGRIVKMGAA